MSNALSTSFRQTLRSGRLIRLIYGVTLVLGLVVSLPFYNTLIAEDQNSLAFLNLLVGFDYTVFSDFMHRSGRSLRPLLSVGRWLGVVYVLLSLFFAGGILLHFSNVSATGLTTRFSAGSFWQGCSHYFGRFVRLFGVTLLFVIAGGGLWLVVGSLVSVLLNDVLTERGQFWVGLGFFGLFMLTVTLLLCIGDYAKVLMFREDERNVLRAYGRAGRLVLRHPGRTFGPYWLLILTGTGLFGVYFLIDELILMRNWPTILLMLVVQQALVFARVGLKVWALGTAYGAYESLPKPAPVVRSAPVSLAVDEQSQPSPALPDVDNQDVWSAAFTKTQAREQREHDEYTRLGLEPTQPTNDTNLPRPPADTAGSESSRPADNP